MGLLQPSVGLRRTALLPDWHTLLESMATLGRMQLWVGNPATSLVRWVRWDEVQVRQALIDFVSEGIHARLDLPACGIAFASEASAASAAPLVLSIHDRAGDVAMEFRFPARVRRSFELLVRAYRAGDGPVAFARLPERTVSLPNDAFDVAALRADWDRLGEDRSMHDLLREHRVSFAQCCRLAGHSRARRLRAEMAHARLLAAEEQRVPTIVRVHRGPASAAHIGTICATRSRGSTVLLYACCGFGASIALPQLVQGWELTRPGLDAPSRCLDFVGADDARVLSVAFPGGSHLDYL